MRRPCLFLVLALILSAVALAKPPVRRVVILKIDGLNADLLQRTMSETDSSTGRSKLPWLSHIFAQHGAIFRNFYTRGISLSAPSWSILDTGQHAIIRGNVEYDRYTGDVYDYLNFFPLYLGYARKRQVDMPGVEVLDRAGIPLMIDAFAYQQRMQSFQLYQRGVRWSTLTAVLHRRLRSQLLSPVESGSPAPLATLLNQQAEAELATAVRQPDVLYLDFFNGDADHIGHATNQQSALIDVLKNIDSLAGRIWTAIQASPLAEDTLFVAVSDHGMNNREDVASQGFSLPDFFNSPSGGGHHVVTNRHQLSDFKIMGLDPLVQRVITPSTASSYLAGQASHYPTAWLDLDGNERAAVHLRNNDLNRIHILLQQLARTDLSPLLRPAAAAFLQGLIDSHRQNWNKVVAELGMEAAAVNGAAKRSRLESEGLSRHWTAEQKQTGADKEFLRANRSRASWQHESEKYRSFLAHLQALLDLQPDPAAPFRGSIGDLIPPMLLGDNNTRDDLRHYVVGLEAAGVTLDRAGQLDEEHSFRHVDYFPLIMGQHVRNNAQAALSNYPVDFLAIGLPDHQGNHRYLLYASDQAQLTIRTDAASRISVEPSGGWRAGLPLHLFEDTHLSLPRGADRAQWLSAWHTDQEWLAATHLCDYSNAVVGITEELSSVEELVPSLPHTDPVLLRYERRRRALVQADFHIFAANGWNFNARDFNPGGNHGSFLRTSTHSVWMMSGAGLATQKIEDPCDSLNFASTVLHLLGGTPPVAERVIRLEQSTVH